jgi:hypothetical protein
LRGSTRFNRERHNVEETVHPPQHINGKRGAPSHYRLLLITRGLARRQSRHRACRFAGEQGRGLSARLRSRTRCERVGGFGCRRSRCGVMLDLPRPRESERRGCFPRGGWKPGVSFSAARRGEPKRRKPFKRSRCRLPATSPSTSSCERPAVSRLAFPSSNWPKASRSAPCCRA